MSKRSSSVAHGVDAVAAALPAEWEEFERPGGVIAAEREKLSMPVSYFKALW